MDGRTGLEQLRRKLGGIASPQFRQEVLASLAEEARKLIYEGFQKSQTPDGQRWKPLKGSEEAKALARRQERAKNKKPATAWEKFEKRYRKAKRQVARAFGAASTAKRPSGGGGAGRKAKNLARRLPLLDTGRLRNAILVRPTHAGILVRVPNVVYAATHQHGRGAIPARPFLPTGGQLPARWATAFRKAVDSAFQRRMS